MNEERDKERLEEFGAHLREIREKLGMSQDELASKCALGKGNISQIENGRKNFTFTSFLELAKGLGVHPKKLLHKDFDFLKEK